jgi:hypothetical protein
VRRAVILAAALGAFSAAAHPEGFHQHVRVVVHADRVEALVVLEVDRGRRSQLLRAGADVNGDRRLDAEEVARLRLKLQGLALGKLKLALSGYAPKLVPVDGKLNLGGDLTTSDEALSLAVLVEARLPRPVSEGMELVVEASSPDRSHVKVEAEQAIEGAKAPFAESDLRPGERLRLKLTAPAAP